MILTCLCDTIIDVSSRELYRTDRQRNFHVRAILLVIDDGIQFLLNFFSSTIVLTRKTLPTRCDRTNGKPPIITPYYEATSKTIIEVMLMDIFDDWMVLLLQCFILLSLV